MIIFRNPKQIQQALKRSKLKGKTIGFVPTMGALHSGHLSLIRKARKENDITVVSIFVNPAQFGPREDFKRYPRPIKSDVSLCRQAGVDFIFYPKAGLMYPDNFKTYVSVEKLSDVLCGKSRPGHFKGVATIVTKLFNLVSPDVAYFGSKDAQQAVIIKKLVDDLNFPVKIEIMPTVREKDGLALSSRNFYLSDEERAAAPVLFRALNFAKDLIKNGQSQSAGVINSMKRIILKEGKIKIDYLSIVNAETLEPMKNITGVCFIVLAVKLGKTRLIDNIAINPADLKKN